MADNIVPPQAPSTAEMHGVDHELLIDIMPDDRVRCEGTRAQLEAEGLIPKGFEWPHAAANKHWDSNGFDYWLRRSRPDGHKGPMSSWMELDNLFVRVTVTGRDYHWRTRRGLERKALIPGLVKVRCTRKVAA